MSDGVLRFIGFCLILAGVIAARAGLDYWCLWWFGMRGIVQWSIDLGEDR